MSDIAENSVFMRVDTIIDIVSSDGGFESYIDALSSVEGMLLTMANESTDDENIKTILTALMVFVVVEKEIAEEVQGGCLRAQYCLTQAMK